MSTSKHALERVVSCSIVTSIVHKVMEANSQNSFHAKFGTFGAGKLPRLMDLTIVRSRHTRPEGDLTPNMYSVSRYDRFIRPPALRDMTEDILCTRNAVKMRVHEVCCQQWSGFNKSGDVEHSPHPVNTFNSVFLNSRDGSTSGKRARRKEQCRFNQANYRTRKRQQERNLLAQICALQSEIDALEKRKKKLSYDLSNTSIHRRSRI